VIAVIIGHTISYGFTFRERFHRHLNKWIENKILNRTNFNLVSIVPKRFHSVVQQLIHVFTGTHQA